MKATGWFLIGVMALIGLVVMGINALASLRQAAAMESAAQAVEIQATSQAASSVGATVAITVLATLVVGLVALIAVMWRRLGMKQSQGKIQVSQTQPTGQWMAGPNAKWRRKALPGGQDQITAEDLARAVMLARMLKGGWEGGEIGGYANPGVSGYENPSHPEEDGMELFR